MVVQERDEVEPMSIPTILAKLVWNLLIIGIVLVFAIPFAALLGFSVWDLLFP